MKDINLRRSVREYSDKDVSLEDIKKILESAMLAPSARNGQPWEFLVVKDQKKKEDKQAFAKKVREECAKAINQSKEWNLDLFDIYKSFDRFSHKKWNGYLKTLANKNDYVQDTEFFISVMVNDTD